MSDDPRFLGGLIPKPPPPHFWPEDDPRYEPEDDFEDFPAPNDPPHTTRKGKIVYRRKKHYFTVKDLERVAKAVERAPESTSEDILDFYWDQVRKLSRQILPGWIYDFVETFSEGYQRLTKRASSGEFGNFLQFYREFIKTVFTNWRDWLDKHTINWVPFIKDLVQMLLPDREERKQLEENDGNSEQEG